MKLSDLVRMANGTDPEILIVQSDGRHWDAQSLDAEPNPLLGLKDEFLIIAADKSKRSLLNGNFEMPKLSQKRPRDFTSARMKVTARITGFGRTRSRKTAPSVASRSNRVKV